MNREEMLENFHSDANVRLSRVYVCGFNRKKNNRKIFPADSRSKYAYNNKK